MITHEYVRQLIEVHRSRVWGASGYSHAFTIMDYRKTIGAETILDYGCGRGTLKETLNKIDSISPDAISEYDPAIPGKDNTPNPADLLVANDVLEHIERDHLEETLSFMRSLAIKGAYFTIALTPSKVSLPDGRNAHLIIKPKQWWLDKLEKAGFVVSKAELRKGLWVWA